mmetsp:Transcript_58934/g.184969  ORF Transcript_58934/g.184969 Transcript_58934/m.184969 type:complete len:250 (-) Transcript_58934:28-777(-)
MTRLSPLAVVQEAEEPAGEAEPAQRRAPGAVRSGAEVCTARLPQTPACNRSDVELASAEELPPAESLPSASGPLSLAARFHPAPRVFAAGEAIGEFCTVTSGSAFLSRASCTCRARNSGSQEALGSFGPPRGARQGKWRSAERWASRASAGMGSRPGGAANGAARCPAEAHARAAKAKGAAKAAARSSGQKRGWPSRLEIQGRSSGLKAVRRATRSEKRGNSASRPRFVGLPSRMFLQIIAGSRRSPNR